MEAHPLFGSEFPPDTFLRVDLSADNPNLGDALGDPDRCQRYLDEVLQAHGRRVAYGGYLEKRALYRGFSHFNPAGATARDLHLGVDFWAPAGTGVYAPWDGRVHSWANRRNPGDYGGVLILEHALEGIPRYSLYGHLDPRSLEGLSPGRAFRRGDRMALLGSPEHNGGYAPHLHFQLIRDLQGFQGDYPGVCTSTTLSFYRENCPDPMAFPGVF